MNDVPSRADGDLKEIITRYQSMVYGLALARTGSSQDADDVFQETFLAYYRAGKDFRDEQHRKAWLLRTALNMARRVTASTWRQKIVPLEAGEDVPALFQEPEENRVWQALMSLDEELRLPLYLYYFEELSTDQVAQALHLRPGTARMRMSRGRDKLRNLLKGDCFDE